MNKKIISIFAILLCVACAIANPVEPNRAMQVAKNYLSAISPEGKKMADKGLVRGASMAEFPDLMLFTTPDNRGFILVAADDWAYPILGYSCTSRFVSEGMPDHVHDWLENYQRQIVYMRDNQILPSLSVLRMWQSLSRGTAYSLPLSTSVSPLLSTTWNQDPYYNDLCPIYSGSTHCATGCVATATAQVMKYWNWPTSGTGSHSYTHNGTTLSADFGSATYDWTNMPNQLTASSSTTQVSAVALLMYHLGVSMEMSYSYSSGASISSLNNTTSACAENSLKNYFKYKSSLTSIYRACYTDEQWGALLRAELDQNRPIIYGGFGSGGGHCFVFDGYNASGLFHVNWGWGGYCDGYYQVGELNPRVGGTGSNTSGTYNANNQAIVGIEPNYSTSTSSQVTAQSANTTLGTVTGGGTYTNGQSISLVASASEGCRFVRWSDGSVYNPRNLVADGSTLNLTAQFERLHGDTLGYCSDVFTGSRSGYSGGSKYGIRLPASVLTAGHDLYQVQLFLYSAGTYELKVYVGNSLNNANLVHTQQLSHYALNQWNTIDLTEPVPITGNDPVWIMISSQDAQYAYTRAFWSGNADGQYFMPYSYSSSSYTDGQRGSAMVRGIFSATQPESYCAHYNEVSLYTSTSTLTDNRIPINFGYSYSVTEMIVDSAELGGAMNIDQIAFNLNTAYSLSGSVEIYLQPTSRTTFSSCSRFESFDPERGVMVFSGDVDLGPDWNTILFDTPFPYDGHSNLMVIVNNTTGGYYSVSIPFRMSTTSGYKTVSSYYDYQQYDVSSLPPSQGTCFVTTNRPWMKLGGCEISAVEMRDTVCVKYRVVLQSSSSALGTTAGSGEFPDSTPTTIMAIPEAGHRFVRWSDGNTQNPRHIVVDTDITLTAIFE